MMRVLMVTPRYLPDAGGVQNHVYQVARRLTQRGLDVRVLSTDPQRRYPADELMDGVRVRRVRAWPAQRDWYFSPDIAQMIARESWQIVHVQSYHTFVAPIAMHAAWRARIPYVVTFHGGGHSSSWRNRIRGLQLQALRPWLVRAARLIATAKFEIEFYRRQLRTSREHFVYSPNGGDIAALKCDAACADPSLIISIGRVERYKGHQHVIAALPHLLRQRPDVRLRVLGTGPYERDLQQLAQQLGVAERVEIRGVPLHERDAMAQTLARAALVVSMSEYETHPMAALEALALGKSLLVADSTGLSELAADGLARAVPLRSAPRKLAQAMAAQLQQPHTPREIKLPTWDDCAAQLHALYEQHALKAKPCAS